MTQCPPHSVSAQGSKIVMDCNCEAGWYRNLTSCVSTCSDGIRVEGEECDDGNNVGDDGCSALCRIDEGWKCGRASDLDPDKCFSTCGRI
jgi:cysteine-rich repeat protein